MSIKKHIRLPLLLILAVLIMLALLRLAFWQFDRAAQKQQLLNQQVSRAQQAPLDLLSISPQLCDDYRFVPITATGRFLPDKSIYIDNRVVNAQVGYWVFTPFLLTASDTVVLVNRGWLPVGESRAVLPDFVTSTHQQTLSGRLNRSVAAPPFWDEAYAVHKGAVWQYLPIQQYAAQMQLKVLPLVLELAINSTPETAFIVQPASISDQGVAKHRGYAWQWLAMAAAFFIACCVLLFRRSDEPI